MGGRGVIQQELNNIRYMPKLRKFKELNRWEEEGINPCPKCSQTMFRRGHRSFQEYLTKKVYFYKEWDYCKGCKHIQHYESEKCFPGDFKIGESLVGEAQPTIWEQRKILKEI